MRRAGGGPVRKPKQKMRRRRAGQPGAGCPLQAGTVTTINTAGGHRGTLCPQTRCHQRAPMADGPAGATHHPDHQETPLALPPCRHPGGSMARCTLGGSPILPRAAGPLPPHRPSLPPPCSLQGEVMLRVGGRRPCCLFAAVMGVISASDLAK